MKIDALQALDEAMKLLQRYDKGQGFQRYVKSRMELVVPVALLMIATSIAFASATIVLAGPRIWLALPAMVLAPFILLGSLLVQAYLFFSWLENRAMAKALGHATAAPGPLAAWVRKNLRAELGAPPPVPWEFVAIFLAVPLVILLAVSWKVAAALVLAQLAAPVVFARLDRQA